MMLSLSKIFWLAIILLCVWYLFKIIEKRKVNSSNSKANGESNSRKGIDAYKC
jgi:beta-lactamase regulating signal transducer with metallopeptidase domain